jgi:hypothetical protein
VTVVARKAARFALTLAPLLASLPGCAQKRPAAAAPMHPASAPPLGGDTVPLHGYVGRSLIEAEVVATDAGFHGCYRELGTNSRARFDGALGAETSVADASGAPGANQSEPHVFDCRFESRSDIARLGGIVARCSSLDGASPASWEVNGAFYPVKGGVAAPFYLAPASYPSVPDELTLALARAEAPVRACAPFLDVLDVKSLPGERRAVLYARSFPCEAEAQNAGEERAEPALARLRLALFPKSDPAHPHVVPLPAEDDAEAVELHVYELTAGQEIFELERSDEGLTDGGARTYVTLRRSLFALTRSGRAGPLLELPNVPRPDGCDPYDALELARVELDGDAPPELVVDTEHVTKPCSESENEPIEPTTSEYVVYSFDAELARFAPLAVESTELGRRERTPLDDIALADDAWQGPRPEAPCSAPAAP